MNRRLSVLLVPLLMGLSMSACSTSPFVDGAYRDPLYPVSVAANPDGRIISAEWLVDEWQLDAQERPVRRARLPWGVHRTDLVLRHRSNEGRIWLDVFTIPLTERDLELSVLANRIVSDVGAGGASKFHGARTEVHRVAEDQLGIDGHPAHLIMIEAGSGEGAVRAALVLVRANMRLENERQRRLEPVLLVAGYVNDAAHFEEGLADFRTFLGGFELGPSYTSPDGEPLRPTE